MTLRSVCLHGPESTGKSTLGAQLSRHFGSPYVPEYGRTYTETFGTNWTMADLVEIARGHDAQTREALASGPVPVILDTDPLMTAVWADMLFGRRDAWFDAWDDPANLYLLLDIDLPWVDDGTRMFGGQKDRARFFDLCRAELDRRGVRWALVGGQGPQRFANALAAIDNATL